MDARTLINTFTIIRREAKISQAELSKRTGYSQQVISRMECGKSTPSIYVFCKLLDALGYKLRIVKKEER